MGNIIVVASGKGGVGKSMFSVNLGATLAQKGKKVVLIDMDWGLRNLDIYLGLENRAVYDVADVMSGICRVKQALIKDRRFDGLHLIAAAFDKDKVNVDRKMMVEFCEKLKDSFDYIILDAPPGLGEGFELAASAAEIAIIITTAEHVSLRTADSLDKILQKSGVKKRLCIVNKVKFDLIGKGILPSVTQISDILKPPMLGIIQYDENIHISTNKGVPVVLKKSSYIADNFVNIADRLDEFNK